MIFEDLSNPIIHIYNFFFLFLSTLSFIETHLSVITQSAFLTASAGFLKIETNALFFLAQAKTFLLGLYLSGQPILKLKLNFYF